MQTLQKHSTYTLVLLLVSALFSASSAMAETDLTAQQNYLKALAAKHQTDASHAVHAEHTDKSKAFHGVFYGFIPCNDCDGIKTTLSLKQNNNYLLVTQSAKESSREFYEKGKYTWNDETQMVALTPRKSAAVARQYHIEDENRLIQLNEDGTRMVEHAERYALHRSDTVKSREIHFH